MPVLDGSIEQILAVLCEDSKSDIFRQAASLCRHEISLDSTSEIVFTWVDHKAASTDSGTITDVRSALGTADREMVGYPLTDLCFAMSAAGNLRAVGLGSNRQKIERAAFFALFLSKVLSKSRPDMGLFDAGIREELKLASQARHLSCRRRAQVSGEESLRNLQGMNALQEAQQETFEMQRKEAEQEVPQEEDWDTSFRDSLRALQEKYAGFLQEAEQEASESQTQHADAESQAVEETITPEKTKFLTWSDPQEFTCTGVVCGLRWPSVDAVPHWSKKSKKPWCHLDGCSATVAARQGCLGTSQSKNCVPPPPPPPHPPPPPSSSENRGTRSRSSRRLNTGAQPEKLGSQQVALIQSIGKGASCFDPAQNTEEKEKKEKEKEEQKEAEEALKELHLNETRKKLELAEAQNEQMKREMAQLQSCAANAVHAAATAEATAAAAEAERLKAAVAMQEQQAQFHNMQQQQQQQAYDHIAQQHQQQQQQQQGYVPPSVVPVQGQQQQQQQQQGYDPNSDVPQQVLGSRSVGEASLEEREQQKRRSPSRFSGKCSASPDRGPGNLDILQGDTPVGGQSPASPEFQGENDDSNAAELAESLVKKMGNGKGAL